MGRATTIKQLKDSGYVNRSVKHEIRENLISKIRRGEPLFPGIIGYDNSVIPQIENAILSGHDILLLGHRGQAKTRMMRSFVSLLDPEIPIVEGCEIRDDPLSPICKRCRARIRELGDSTPITWISREERYHEKLATPDVSIADLIGEIDPIKVAEGRYLSDEDTIHFGLIPRSHRGIFALNELPDLPERIQVGLFNILEERDVQIRGFTVRIPLDIFLIATANPENYTSRGRIVTPLKDRFGSQIRTHYPLSRQEEIEIIEQERRKLPEEEEERLEVPDFIKEIVAEISRLARAHPEIDQSSGVSVRVSIDNMEVVIANALRRFYRFKESRIVPRICDLTYIEASSMGKIEIEGFSDSAQGEILEELIEQAIAKVFEEYWGDYDFTLFLKNFEAGKTIVVSDLMASIEYAEQASRLEGSSYLFEHARAETDEHKAATLEFVLEGLHARGNLKKERIEENYRFIKR